MPVVDLGVAADPVAAFLEAHAAGRDVALRTSGTTSGPRAVVRSTGSWVGSFGHVARLTGLTAGSRLWVPGPLSSTMNLFAAVLGAWVGAERCGAADATHAHLTPTAMRRVLDDGVPVAGLHLTVAGDVLPPALHARATAAGARVDHYYGAAELSFVGWGAHAGDLRAFPGAEVEERGGVLWVRSPYLAHGLRRDADGFATVGDRGRVDRGRVEVTGRGSAAVTTGAATVLVADVEDVLRAAVRGEVVVVGTPHAELGQVVTAVLTDPEDHGAAWRAARDRLAPEQRPRRWYWLAELPTTVAGKVDRAEVAHRLASGGQRLAGAGARP